MACLVIWNILTDAERPEQTEARADAEKTRIDAFDHSSTLIISVLGDTCLSSTLKKDIHTLNNLTISQQIALSDMNHI